MTDVGTTRRKAMGQMRRLRIWESHKGVCILCGLKIDGVREEWIVEHVRPLALLGDDDQSNMRPAHKDCHATKTKADAASWSKAKRCAAKHNGIRKPSTWRKPPPGYNAWTRRIER